MKNPNNPNNPNVKSGKVKHALKRGAGAAAIVGAVAGASFGVYEFVKPAESAQFATETPHAAITPDQHKQLDTMVTSSVRANFKDAMDGLADGSYTKLTDPRLGGSFESGKGDTITKTFEVHATPGGLTLKYDQYIDSPAPSEDGTSSVGGFSEFVLTSPNTKHLTESDILLKPDGEKAALAAVLANPATQFRSFVDGSVGIDVTTNDISANFAGPFESIVLADPTVVALSDGLHGTDPGQAFVDYTRTVVTGK